MGSNLCRSCAFSSNLLQVPLDLFSSWTGRIQIFLRIALDFQLTVLTALDLVTESLQTNRKVRTINTGRVLLRLEKAALLQRSRLAILTRGQIENDGMGMKLRRSVAIHRAGSVMLEGGGNELAGRLGRVDIADTRLRIPFQFTKRYADTLTVRHTHAFIATDKRGERDGFRR